MPETDKVPKASPQYPKKHGAQLLFCEVSAWARRAARSGVKSSGDKGCRGMEKQRHYLLTEFLANVAALPFDLP